MSDATERDAPEEGDERFSAASQWTLMRWKFRKHRLAMVSLFVIAAFYLVAVFCEFLAPHDIDIRFKNYVYAPPQRLRFIHEGRFSPRPFVYGLTRTIDAETLRRIYTPDTSRRLFIRFFTHGAPYRFWGLFPADIRLMGVEEGGTLFILGTDQLGRDLFSRLLHGTRISLSIGLVGVALSFVIGLVLGGLSGFYGGAVDIVIQRIIEILQSFPTIPLWLGLSAALPADWPVLRIYFGITIILSFIGWTGLARVVRGKFLALREEDFAVAARVAGSSEMRIIFRHLLPSFMSHIIVSITLAIPGMILGETALSFLGLGLRPPVVSWGVLLQQAQNVQAVALYPWLLLPVFCVIALVLAFNFVGDGMRDAADPYSR